jgi:ATP-dependent Lhr-like helicase
MIAMMATEGFWDQPDMRLAILTRLPGYRLSKFQDCLPPRFALKSWSATCSMWRAPFGG